MEPKVVGAFSRTTRRYIVLLENVPLTQENMNFPDVAYKTSAGLLGVATLVLGIDLVYTMTKVAFGEKTPVSPQPTVGMMRV